MFFRRLFIGLIIMSALSSEGSVVVPAGLYGYCLRAAFSGFSCAAVAANPGAASVKAADMAVYGSKANKAGAYKTSGVQLENFASDPCDSDFAAGYTHSIQLAGFGTVCRISAGSRSVDLHTASGLSPPPVGI